MERARTKQAGERKDNLSGRRASRGQTFGCVSLISVFISGGWWKNRKITKDGSGDAV